MSPEKKKHCICNFRLLLLYYTGFQHLLFDNAVIISIVLTFLVNVPVCIGVYRGMMNF